VKFNVVCTPGS